MIFPRSCVKQKLLTNSIFYLCLFIFISCASTSTAPVLPQTADDNSNQKSCINLVFAGDIMAHTVNYQYKNYRRIWEDVTPLISSGDLAFANIEAPVNDNQEWSSYPQFNMHSDYIQAAIDAGFNVFSLTNNHTNDWYLDGITATRNYFSKKKNLWAAGLRKKNDGNLTWQLIEKNDWRILFVSVTEILNRPEYASWIDYYPAKKRQLLMDQLKKLTEEVDYDLFVLSVHTDEEEYVTSVTDSHKAYFRQLIEECGVDIVWANHPHVSKIFEKVKTETRNGFIMYANGNTISGQRTAPSLRKPHNSRDNTGDGLIIKVSLEKTIDSKTKTKTMTFNSIEPHFITTYIRPDGQMVVKLVDEDLIHSLNRAGVNSWASYLTERIKNFETIKGHSIWQ